MQHIVFPLPLAYYHMIVSTIMTLQMSFIYMMTSTARSQMINCQITTPEITAELVLRPVPAPKW
jgi:hypothetical protein